MKKLIAIAVAVALVITLFAVVIPVGAQDDISFNPYPPALFMRVDKGYGLPFSDINVRRALAMSIDNEAIKDIYYGGNAEVLAWPIMPTPEFIDMYTPLEELPESASELYGYNPTKAKQMLADAGYPEGFMVTIVCNVYQADLLVMIHDYFAEIGVVLEIDVKEYAEWASIGTNKTYEYMYMHSVNPTIPFEFSRLLPGMPHNYSMIDDPVINEAYAAIAAAEEPEKSELMKAIVPYILEQGYILVPPVSYTKTTVHELMIGQKLVGQGRYAEWEDDGIHERINTGVILTNPDCVSEITIDRISVFAYDGRLVYEGPLFKWREEIPWAEPMKPHETRISDLNQYLSGFEWPPEAPDVWMNFTVEIFWSNSDSKGLPLAGWVDTAIIRRNSEGHLIDIELAGSTEMVNMEQILKSKD